VPPLSLAQPMGELSKVAAIADDEMATKNVEKATKRAADSSSIPYLLRKGYSSTYPPGQRRRRWSGHTACQREYKRLFPYRTRYHPSSSRLLPATTIAIAA
jgi:hypothetical protein